MNSFSEELRKEREAQNITLFDIAKKTRINIKYLEAIERGTFDVLPQTYIRAFLKSYAEVIGLNSARIIKQYEIQILGANAELRAQNAAASITDESFKNNNTEAAAKELAEQTKIRKAIYAIALVVVIILLTLYLTNYIKKSVSKRSITETPFQEIVQEKEVKSIPPAVSTPDSSAVSSVAAEAPVTVVPESLVLRAVAIDSIWINIALDDKPVRRGYVLAGGKREWNAKNEIILSVSDAGKIKFTLNGKEYSVGKRGQRVRGYRITADTLARILQ